MHSDTDRAEPLPAAELEKDAAESDTTTGDEAVIDAGDPEAAVSDDQAADEEAVVDKSLTMLPPG